MACRFRALMKYYSYFTKQMKQSEVIKPPGIHQEPILRLVY